ncbi:protein of unknown function [Pseudodesulfovibrio piezophilus C1TLV30]|uniref:Uncharacterized protein n=1 Tax=Pseudodesulfovibrio piezophilus (strain DSM 21447 / JCM 15486 / C1TLV30) TaxID=1322246 RepID=M1WK05_PSEP2|nr:protein of unknown function [Pseudodesulfovibrio piezophilus C1TLV30]
MIKVYELMGDRANALDKKDMNMP